MELDQKFEQLTGYTFEEVTQELEKSLKEIVESEEFKKLQQGVEGKLEEIADSEEFKEAKEEIEKGLEDLKKNLFGR